MENDVHIAYVPFRTIKRLRKYQWIHQIGNNAKWTELIDVDSNYVLLFAINECHEHAQAPEVNWFIRALYQDVFHVTSVIIVFTWLLQYYHHNHWILCALVRTIQILWNHTHISLKWKLTTKPTVFAAKPFHTMLDWRFKINVVFIEGGLGRGRGKKRRRRKKQGRYRLTWIAVFTMTAMPYRVIEL